MKMNRTGLALALWVASALGAQAATLQVTVLDRNGRPLPDAVVMVESDGAKPPAAEASSATVEQRKMQFVPEVSLVTLGSKLRFTNLDRYEHHVRGRPAGMAGLAAGSDRGFQLRLDGLESGKPGASAEVTLDRAGPIQLGCHLHGSMRGFVFVADSPWTAKTGENGVAMLQGLPEGVARVRIWHPELLTEAAPTALTLTPVTAVRVETRVVPRRQRL